MALGSNPGAREVKALLLTAALSGCLPLASSAAIAADWYQTRGITQRCGELNPLIGQCGDRVPVDIYFPVAIAANLAAGWISSKFQWLVLGAEGSIVWSNWAQGD